MCTIQVFENEHGQLTLREQFKAPASVGKRMREYATHQKVLLDGEEVFQPMECVLSDDFAALREDLDYWFAHHLKMTREKCWWRRMDESLSYLIDFLQNLMQQDHPERLLLRALN